jgi:hypothetical protein
MAWRFDKPLVSLADDEQNKKAMQIWEGESLGGLTEDNNRLPQPVVWLLALTIVTAFLITAPLWGQRPQAAIYKDYVALMDSPEVQGIDGDAQKMDYIVKNAPDSKYKGLQERHPVTMDDLRMVKDQIVELENANVDLEEYTVVGNKVVLANFEGEKGPDGNKIRKQPSWDPGYTIDVFYVMYFCISVIIVVKRLPHFSIQPTHFKH